MTTPGMPIDTADVMLWGSRIGVVYWDDGNQVGVFEYEPRFVGSAVELSPIVMPLRRGPYSFRELSRPGSDFKGLPGLLADSLPDSWGYQLLNAALEARGRPANSFNPVEQLCYVGTRGMGALEFEPATHPRAEAVPVDVDWIAELAGRVVAQRSTLATHLDPDGLEDLIRVGSSVGGQRAKALIAWNPETNDIRSGQVDAPEGYEQWILKFDGLAKDGSGLGDPVGWGRVEFAYSNMARACDITMSESRILHDESGRAHFMTKRFDRGNGRTKWHVQTLSAMGHFDYNQPGLVGYEDAMDILLRLDAPFSDLEQLFKVMVFNVVGRNQDDHTKNISFVMDVSGVWRIAPAYDLTWSYNPDGAWTSVHQMSVNGKRNDFTSRDLVDVGRRYGIARPEQIVRSTVDVFSSWDRFALDADVPTPLRRMVGDSVRLEL
jgi:serine/threonine-protein kinase HipA